MSDYQEDRVLNRYLERIAHAQEEISKAQCRIAEAQELTARCACEGLSTIAASLEEIAVTLKQLVVQTPTGFGPIVQISGGDESMPTNLSIAAGTRGIFNTTYLPAGAVAPAGSPAPVWVASDPSIIVGNDPSDPTGLTVDVDVPANSTLTSFQLALSQVINGATISGGPVTIAVTPAQAPVPTGFGPINQLS
jgi:hypothetical protein